MENFKYPFFATNFSDFWRRWHISLTTWFRDYVYYPMVGSSSNITKRLFSFMAIFLLSGLWHGANWTFIIWGFANALCAMPSFLYRKKQIDNTNIILQKISNFFKAMITFLTFSILVIFFRAENIFHASSYISGLLDFSDSHFELKYTNFSLCLIAFMLLEFVSRHQEFPLQKLKNAPVKYLYHLILILLILAYGYQENPFIYFAF